MSNSTPTESTAQVPGPGMHRVAQVFQYLRALNQLRNPAKRQIAEQPWVLWLDDLPACDAVQPGARLAPDNGVEGDFILRVARPKTTPAPPPPAALADWLEPGWERPDGVVSVPPERLAADAQAPLEAFTADAERVAKLEAYEGQWRQWAAAERPNRAALKLFERLYTLHSQLEREGERIELALGDGMLSWRRPDGGLHHPILTTRLSLDFDPAVPAFSLRETDRPVELYTALFAGLADVQGRTLARWNQVLDPAIHHPLDGEDTTSMFRTLVSLLSSQGELVDAQALSADADHPRIARRPVIFSRSRTLGYAVALEGILDDLGGNADVAPALLRIVGCQDEAEAALERRSQRDAPDVLFSKVANPEQYRIAETLDKYGAVLVQGPPGTGKSYTIGNLIGHLLAQGKTVLVTSHTTKALQVVREHVAEDLRSLCVCVLDRDEESRQQLETSVANIVARLSGEAANLDAQAAQFATQRAAISAKLAANHQHQLDAMLAEVHPIVIAGEAVAPTTAAEEVAGGAAAHAWIPGPLRAGEPSPLTETELLELYGSNAALSIGDERALGLRLPALSALPSPDEFAAFVDERHELACVPGPAPDLWAGLAAPAQLDLISRLGNAVEEAASRLDRAHEWELEAFAAGTNGGIYKKPWEDLCAHVEATAGEIAEAEAKVVEQGAVLPAEVDRSAALETFRAIASHLREGGGLGPFMLILKPGWKKLLSQARVAAGQPKTLAHVDALIALSTRDLARINLRGRWERLVGAAGGPGGDSLGPEPELTALQFLPRLNTALAWNDTHLRPLTSALKEAGFGWERWLDAMPPEVGASGVMKRLRAAIAGLAPHLRSRSAAARLEALAEQHAGWHEALASADTTIPQAAALQAAVAAAEPAAYQAAWSALSNLAGLQDARERRHRLLARLELAAPTWAAAIRARVAPHDGSVPPGDPAKAWRWRQIAEELDRRDALSLERLQAGAEGLEREKLKATTALIDRRAWAAQRARTTLTQQQALVGWLQTVKRIGKGTGKRVPELQAEARRLMAACQSAIPVWVMPLARVAENFDPRHTRFDVVIIDEASQSDAMALAALYLGKQVVVVGDDQQVSPDAVGQVVEEVTQLIDTHLRGVPNAHLYDGLLSVYDLAKNSFVGSVCLVEHFRCVPPIIEFSNHLSYHGALRPLREASSARITPAVIPHMVSHGAVTRKVNQVEALEVASLIAAAIELPAYNQPEPATFGVISLVGEEQALAIEAILRRHLPPIELERRRLLCGNPAQFQGDERDVIFLSMVDAPADGPLVMRADERFQKRFNVAASRARDQLWVVHSVDPQTDLKPGDLRRRLIEHARDPWALASSAAKAERAAESPFEQAVIRRLVAAGYKVTPQWPVGHYRIDLVVEGGGKRLAIECDGERFHPPEALEADLARQAILERLGWRFARIRGSAFYRDPVAAMQPVFTKLEAMGIPPGKESDTPRAEPTACEQEVVRRAAALRQAWLAQAEREESAAP